MSEEKHEYDGIIELDNNLPRWWLATFWGTIAFAAAYWGYYELGPGPTLTQEYEKIAASAEAATGGSGGFVPDESVLAAAVRDDGRKKQGGEVFKAKCASCHGQRAEGSIGPNLTDAFWIHGKGKPADIAKVVAEGVLEKGMPPWRDLLGKDELVSVVSYVKSLKGTSPAGGKAPQGDRSDE